MKIPVPNPYPIRPELFFPIPKPDPSRNWKPLPVGPCMYQLICLMIEDEWLILSHAQSSFLNNHFHEGINMMIQRQQLKDFGERFLYKVDYCVWQLISRQSRCPRVFGQTNSLRCFIIRLLFFSVISLEIYNSFVGHPKTSKFCIVNVVFTV